MAYQKNKPAASDKLKNSQGDLLGNFQALNDLIAVNHDISTFTSPASGDEGKHNKIDMPNLAVTPTPTGTDAVVYNQALAATSRQELFFKTSAITYPITAGLRASAGWARIGGGIYLIWRTQTSIANATTDTTLDLTHCPASGTILSVTATPFSATVTGTTQDYIIQATGHGATATVGIFQRSVATSTRLASKTFSFLVMRL